MVQSLTNMKLGQTAVITGYASGNPAYRAKLLALGLTRGTRFTVSSIAPLGDPIGITVRNFNLSLRREEAAVLQIKLVETGAPPLPEEVEEEQLCNGRKPEAAERIPAPETQHDPAALRIALIGNPNSGKTTVFNMMTGSRQRIGNWPGVTVEKKEGTFNLADGKPATLVDLPGIYSLSASSEDERVAFSYAISGQADLFVNVIDGTNLERNLYLTFLLLELRIPMIVVVTMMDIVESRRINLDLEQMARLLGCPVVGVNATSKRDLKRMVEAVSAALGTPMISSIKVAYPNEIDGELDALEALCKDSAVALHVPARWVASRLLKNDPFVKRHTTDAQKEAARAAGDRIAGVLKSPPDVMMADARYGMIHGLCKEIQREEKHRGYFSEKLDKVLLNRVLGIPLFLLGMYLVFWVTITVGGAFIDFFDILGGTVFVDGFGFLLEKISAPEWLIALLAGGVGAGLQTMATFIPPIFFMFFCLSLLEDSGYMARAAFVMDRFMRWLGLPGKSFVPMLVGFGCSVPAIMATRTLENKRDRFLTIFMTPFMSCGAKMPVYALFGAAFFGKEAGMMVFMIYLSGIVLAVATGLLLKQTLFQGEPSHFIMELPPYHLPRFKHIMLHTWSRLKIFLGRAGKVIIPMIMLLGFLNAIDTSGRLGNEDSENSVLSVVGKAISPVFEPMGVEKENWPASVALFTGLFAKEAVVGTLNSLYGQMAAANGGNGNTPATGDEETEPAAEAGEEADGEEEEEEEEGFDFAGGIKEAFATIPENLAGVFGGLLDPLGLGMVSDDEEAVAEELEADSSLFANLRHSFSKGPHQAFAYLLFILLYVPCIAALGAAFRELGKGYGTLLAVYLTVLGWCVATLYYQITLGHHALWITVPVALLGAMFGSFWAMGRKHKIDFQ